MSWVGPDKWRRTIKSQEFSQTLIVNGDKVFEQDSADYLPLGIHVLASAMVDPRTVIDALRPGDPVRTKADGRQMNPGKFVSMPPGKMCGVSRFGLTESVGGPGRSVDFLDYQKFKGKRVARQLIPRRSRRHPASACNDASEFNSRDEGQFSIPDPTPREKQIRSVIVPESDLRALALQPTGMTWPQVLEDNQTTGETSYYVSLDRSGGGCCREILPLSVAVERADDSARRQIMKWKFKPLLKDDVPVQIEAVLNFTQHTELTARPPADRRRSAQTGRGYCLRTGGYACRSGTFGIDIPAVAVDAEGKLMRARSLWIGPTSFISVLRRPSGSGSSAQSLRTGSRAPIELRLRAESVSCHAACDIAAHHEEQS